jgi:hypothetical protein
VDARTGTRLHDAAHQRMIRCGRSLAAPAEHWGFPPVPRSHDTVDCCDTSPCQVPGNRGSVARVRSVIADSGIAGRFLGDAG